MPYIKQDDRDKYEVVLNRLETKLNGKPIGHLTYVVYRLMLARWKTNPCYTTGSGIVGALTTAIHEFMRRKLNVYEDTMIEQNGDVN